jgi:hypothetical protein
MGSNNVVAVKRLAGLCLSDATGQQAIATGTDGKLPAVTSRRPGRGGEKSTPQLTPKSTPAAFSACSSLSSDDTVATSEPKAHAIRSNGINGRLNTQRGGLTPIVSEDDEKPTVGFEPTTPGLQNQSSTVELRWRNFPGRPARNVAVKRRAYSAD